MSIGIELNEVEEPIYLAIYDPKKLTTSIELLSRYRAHYKPINDKCRWLEGVVLADEGGLEFLRSRSIGFRGPIVRIDLMDPYCAVILALTLARGARLPVNELAIGIDLGKTIGFALVADSHIVLTTTFTNEVKLYEELMKVLSCVPAKRKVVRLGVPRRNDEKLHLVAEKIVKMLGSDVELELIPEKGSSKDRLVVKGKRLSDDEVAAINIALARVV